MKLRSSSPTLRLGTGQGYMVLLASLSLCAALAAEGQSPAPTASPAAGAAATASPNGAPPTAPTPGLASTPQAEPTPQATPTLPASQAPPPESGDPSQPKELDKVIAIINGDVLLQSDVLEEMQFSNLQPLSFPGAATDPALAGHRLINRTLILQQMRSQQVTTNVSDEEVRKGLGELRRQIPACVRYRCETTEGWRSFLAHNGLTEQQVNDRWHQRLGIVQFIDSRFHSGIQIADADVAAYYEKTFLPAFKKENATPPALPLVSDRIREILLQQKVSGMLQDWLKSLRDQGTVQILDPLYGTSSGDPNDGGGAA